MQVHKKWKKWKVSSEWTIMPVTYYTSVKHQSMCILTWTICMCGPIYICYTRILWGKHNAHFILCLFLICKTKSNQISWNPMAMEHWLITHKRIVHRGLGEHGKYMWCTFLSAPMIYHRKMAFLIFIYAHCKWYAFSYFVQHPSLCNAPNKWYNTHFNQSSGTIV